VRQHALPVSSRGSFPIHFVSGHPGHSSGAVGPSTLLRLTCSTFSRYNQRPSPKTIYISALVYVFFLWFKLVSYNSQVRVSTRPRQSTSRTFTERGSSAATSSYHAASYRRCGICYFELPASARPIETTSANGVVRYGNIVPPPSDLATRIVDLDINELTERIFCIDTMQHSAERGCENCSKMREILIRFNHHSTVIPTSDALHWLNGYLIWKQEYPGKQPQGLFRTFELISSNPNVEGRTTNKYNRESHVDYLFHKSDHPFVTKGLQPSHTSVGLWCLAEWLAACNSSHMRCGTTVEPPLPSRLLFIEKGSSGPVVFLTETAGMRGRYFCLSHRWGSAQPLRLTKQNLVAYKKFGIPWESMPQTFKDAAILVLELGFNFLWIDSLCIIQDDDKDWKQEAASMGSIYQNSYLTIAATKCHGSDESLFTEINPVYKAIEVTKAGNAPILFRKRLEHPDALDYAYCSLFEEDFPLLTRGWVYQERLLSPRMIHFATNELVWECLEESWCECSRPFEQGAGNQQRSEKSRHSDLFDEIEYVDVCEEWHKIVEKYTTHHLTFKKDTLPALSAVAKRLGATFNFTLGMYLGGLWEGTLAYDFMWVNRLSWDLEQPEEVRPRQHPRPAPTWSWASIEDEVDWSADDDQDTPCRFIDFIRWEATPSGPDEYGQLQSGKLILSGFLKSGILRYSAIDPPAVEVDASNYHLHLDYALQTHGEGYIESGTEVFCLQCGSESIIFDVGQWRQYTLASCLVLLCIDRKSSIYERIGFVRPPRETAYEDWFGEQIPRSDITLV
jgi:hypothetical protein